MYDTSKLRGLIVEKYGTLGAFSKAIGKDLPYVSKILSGQGRMTREAIDEWCDKLEIRPERICTYFFTKKVDSTVTEE